MKNNKLKMISFRVEPTVWKFLKQMSVDVEKPIQKILMDCVLTMQKNSEKSKKKVDEK